MDAVAGVKCAGAASAHFNAVSHEVGEYKILQRSTWFCSCHWPVLSRGWGLVTAGVTNVSSVTLSTDDLNYYSKMWCFNTELLGVAADWLMLHPPTPVSSTRI